MKFRIRLRNVAFLLRFFFYFVVVLIEIRFEFTFVPNF